LGLALVVGVVSGVGAILFYLACQVVFHYALEVGAGYRAHHPGGEPPLFAEAPAGDATPDAEPETLLRPWLLLVIPTLGGLVSGLIVFTFAPEAEGHGTDSAIAAYHFKGGHIRPRVPLVKLLASAITIGTGGSGGREGPIAQIGAGCGSFLASALRLPPAEGRSLMAAGMGAGVAAIFRAPLAGALFAAEVLYRSPDFEPTVIIPAALASVVAYCTFGLAFGWQPLFKLSDQVQRGLTFDNPLQLGPYLFLALFMAVLAMLYTRSFYWLTGLFKRLPFRPHFKPALGAFLTGLVGLLLYLVMVGNVQVLAVLSFGYGALQDALTMPSSEVDPRFAAVLLAIALGKILTTGLTIGSGGSGGVFGPSMVIGGCGGGALGILLNWLAPALVPHPATFVIVGMAGFFAAAAKTPVSTLLMVSELTGNYNLPLPTLWVCAIAFLLSDEQSIYSSQLESRSRSPAHQGGYLREVLAGLSVGRFLTAGVAFPALRPGDRLPEVIRRFSETGYQALPVTDPEGRLQGLVRLEEVAVAAQGEHLRALVVAADLMRGDVTPLRAEDRLDVAMDLFAESDLLVLPVVDGLAEGKVVGMIRRSDVAGAYLRQLRGPGTAEETARRAP
jgi:CIC family chloride channel protein